MKQKRAYTYRFYPTVEQKQILARTFGCVRFVYNWALRKKTEAYYKDHQRLSYKDLSALLPDLKKQKETAWLSDVASVPLQQSLRHLEKAFINFFEGRGNHPQFKKKRNQQSAIYVGTAFIWRDGQVTLASMDEPLAIRWSRPLPEGAKPRSVTVSKDGGDRYFIVGWSEFVSQLAYKAAWYGRTLVKIDRWYPSSKRCFACGHLLASLTLDVRLWTCPECGTRHRDINAANNIQAVGLTVSACGEAVRPGVVKTHPGKPRRSRNAHS